MMNDGLKEKHRKAIIDILAAHSGVEKAVLFGSRAMGTFTVTSDVDIALFGDTLTLTDQARLSAAMDELSVPQRVDLLRYNTIKDEALLRHIDEHGMVWFERRVLGGNCLGVASEWETTKLGEVVELKRGYDLPKKVRKPGLFPVVSSSGISGNHADFKVSSPGVVTGRYGTIGKVFLIKSNFWPLNTTLYVRDFKGNDPRFSYYFLQNINFSTYSSKSAVPGINRNHLHQEVVKLPPISVQKRIAHILGTLDDKIELNRRMNRTLEAMAAAIFKSWFIDFDPVRAKAEGRDTGLPQEIADLFPDSFEDSELGEIPKGWKVGTLGGVCEKAQYGYTATATDESIGPRFLRIKDINKQDWIEWQNVPYCEIEKHKIDKYRLAKGDVVIARMADPGHGALIEEDIDAVFASYLIRFRPIRPELGRFLQYWLRSEPYWNLVSSRQSGTTRANLNAQVLSSFPLVVPDDKVLKVFSSHVDSLRSKLVAGVNESRILASIRDTLLPKLISGELPIPDAERIVGRCVCEG